MQRDYVVKSNSIILSYLVALHPKEGTFQILVECVKNIFEGSKYQKMTQIIFSYL